MSTHYLCTATIYECPQRHIDDTLEVLNDYEFRYDYSDNGDLSHLELGHEYRIEDASAGTYDEVSALLRDLGVAHAMFEEGNGVECDADVIYHVPEFKPYETFDGVGSGVTCEPIVHAHVLKSIIKEFTSEDNIYALFRDPTPHFWALVANIENAAGLPWKRALEAMLPGKQEQDS